MIYPYDLLNNSFIINFNCIRKNELKYLLIHSLNTLLSFVFLWQSNIIFFFTIQCTFVKYKFNYSLDN